jgi:hypothetical protein
MSSWQSDFGDSALHVAEPIYERQEGEKSESDDEKQKYAFCGFILLF